MHLVHVRYWIDIDLAGFFQQSRVFKNSAACSHFDSTFFSGTRAPHACWKHRRWNVLSVVPEPLDRNLRCTCRFQTVQHARFSISAYIELFSQYCVSRFAVLVFGSVIDCVADYAVHSQQSHSNHVRVIYIDLRWNWRRFVNYR